MALPVPCNKCSEFSRINLNWTSFGNDPTEGAVAQEVPLQTSDLSPVLHLGALKRCFGSQLMKCWVTGSKNWHERVVPLLFTFCFPFPEICQRGCYIWIQTELSTLHYVLSCFIAILFKVCVSPTVCFQFIIDALFTHMVGIYEFRCWNVGVTVA